MDYRDYRDNINPEKNIKNLEYGKNLKPTELNDCLGSGGQACVFKLINNKCGTIAVKKYAGISKGSRDEYHMFREYSTMVQTNILISKRIGPNFIQMIGFDPNAQYILMECADGDSNYLFKTPDLDTNIYISFILQILIGLITFRLALNLNHCDFKPANILFKKINPNIVFEYHIKSDIYTVPSFGYLFMLGDFAYASTRNKVDEKTGEFWDETQDLTRMEFDINIQIALYLVELFKSPEDFISRFDEPTQKVLRGLTYPLTKKTKFPLGDVQYTWDFIELIYWTIQNRIIKPEILDLYKPNHIIFKLLEILLRTDPLNIIISSVYTEMGLDKRPKSKSDIVEKFQVLTKTKIEEYK